MAQKPTDHELVDEVLKLTLRCQESTPTEDESARLDVLLSESPLARRVYLLSCNDTATLVRSAAAIDCSLRASRPFRLTHKALFAPVIAACIALTFVGGLWHWSSSHSQMAATQGTKTSQVQTVGRVVSLKNVMWSDGAAEFDEWSQFDVGHSIVIDSGVVSLMMDNSAEIKLEGPADFRLTSAEKAVLSRGNIVVRCGPEAVGFQVESPDVDVVDLGTEFGVSVREGQHTDVVVYDGKVDLTTRVGARPLARRLTAGEALQISHLGEPHRITEVRGDQHLTPLYPLDRGVGLSQRIVAVSDNLPAAETSKFYQVVGGGFREDCRAYVDRAHEWNGIGRAGLPPELVNGDYMMTFNDDKILPVEIEIELAKPSTLYVLLDDRVPLPEWLTNDYLDTGWDVGMDEMHSDRDIEVGVGPGVSIDQVFSVWRRDFPRATRLHLGPIQDMQHGPPPSSLNGVYESMYGVVVTELVEPF